MDRGLVRALRARGFDVVTIFEARRLRLPDEDQLRFAASQDRILYTCNVSHFADLHRVWLRDGLHHAGIIVLPDQRTAVGVQVRAFLHLATTLDADTMRDRLEFLSNWQR